MHKNKESDRLGMVAMILAFPLEVVVMDLLSDNGMFFRLDGQVCRPKWWGTEVVNRGRL